MPSLERSAPCGLRGTIDVYILLPAERQVSSFLRLGQGGKATPLDGLAIFGYSRRGRHFCTGLNYDSQLEDLFARPCDSCHGAARAEGSYRTDSYLALQRGGTNGVPDLIAGDPNCLLVVKTWPLHSMFGRGNLTFLDSEMIHNWVVSYMARR